MAALLALCACAGAHKKAGPAVTPPPILLDQRGTIMPFQKAVTHISFRPFVPSQVLAYAVLPPLGGDDTDANRGLGIEYGAGRTAMVFSQWPKQRFAIAFGHGGTTMETCTIAHYSPQAVAWTTPAGVVMTLQPDGNASPATIDREAQRLIRAGACR
jgi:hypothetical protein